MIATATSRSLNFTTCCRPRSRARPRTRSRDQPDYALGTALSNSFPIVKACTPTKATTPMLYVAGRRPQRDDEHPAQGQGMSRRLLKFLKRSLRIEIYAASGI